MLRPIVRRATGFALALFFVAVAAAPHRHINDWDDLLLDQRSDSGLIEETPRADSLASTPILLPLRLIRDIPCLACFTRDFVSSAAVVVAFLPILTPLSIRPISVSLPAPELVPAQTSSRSPPAAR